MSKISAENEAKIMEYIKSKAVPNETRILKICLTEKIYKDLKDKTTKGGATLWDCIKSGILMPDSKMGSYACDRESYDVYDALFSPMIHMYFRVDSDHPGKNYGDLTKKDICDQLDIASVDTGNMVVSTRVRVARNLENYAYAAKISDKDRVAVLDKIVKVTSTFKDDLAGNFIHLKDLKEDKQKDLVTNHVLFHNKDEYIQKAGMFNDWPSGRGAFYNNDTCTKAANGDVNLTPEASGKVLKKAMIWVNEEDHMRVICLQKGNDLLAVYSRLIKMLNIIEKDLQVATHKKWGFLASCPTNVGTGLRASVHIKIPYVSAMPWFKDFCKDSNIDIRGVHGEHSESSDGTFDISNKRRFGLTEFDAITEMTKGVKNLLRVEQELKRLNEKK